MAELDPLCPVPFVSVCVCVCGGGGGGVSQVITGTGNLYFACGFGKSCNKWSCYYHVVISICIASSHSTCSVVSVGGVSHLCVCLAMVFITGLLLSSCHVSSTGF